MSKPDDSHLLREDFVHALREMHTYVDVGVDDLMEITSRANHHARVRDTEGLRVQQLMSQPVETVTPDTPLAEAAHRMVVRRISGLPVVDARQQLVGIITEADFLRALGVPSHHPSHHLWQTLESLFAHPLPLMAPTNSIAELMVTHVISIGPEQSVREVIDTMKQHRIKRLVVTEGRRVIGMITRSDLVRIFFDHLRGLNTPGTGDGRPADTAQHPNEA